MRALHYKIRHLILGFIDFFYPWFKRIMPLQTFRYAACGGANTLLDISLFFISYNYILHKQPVQFGVMRIGAHIAAFIIGFSVTFPLGYYYSRYVVFQETSTPKREQLTKYFLVVVGCLVLNYFFLKLFVDVFHWYATPSKLITTVFVVFFSYMTQKNFTFKSVSNTVVNR